MGRPGHRAHDDGVEEDTKFTLLHGDLVGPHGKAQPAEPVIGCARRDGIWDAATLFDIGECLLPGVPKADREASRVEPNLSTHDPAEHDVADPVVHSVRPVNPFLLYENAFKTEVSSDGSNLAGVVGLIAANRNERVGTLRNDVGNDVFEFAGLVAAKREPAVDIFPFGPDLRAAEVVAEATQRVNRAGSERQGIAREIRQSHRSSGMR